MKYLHFIGLVVLTFAVFPACKQDSSAVTKAPTESTTAAPTVTETPKEIANGEGVLAMLKSSLQGRWKASAEPGVEYEIKDASCVRYKNGKVDVTLKVTYALYPNMTCGAMNKKYRDVIACVMLTAQDDVCLAVQGFTPQRFDFVKMGDPNGEPESWTK